MSINTHLVELRTIRDQRGAITPIEEQDDIPFKIARVYYLYDINSGSSRGGHAHHQLQQILIAVAGSFDVIVSDGFSDVAYRLNRPNQALYIGPYVWRELHNFSAGSVCLVLASMQYEASDYIRDKSALRKAL